MTAYSSSRRRRRRQQQSCYKEDCYKFITSIYHAYLLNYFEALMSHLFVIIKTVKCACFSYNDKTLLIAYGCHRVYSFGESIAPNVAISSPEQTALFSRSIICSRCPNKGTYALVSPLGHRQTSSCPLSSHCTLGHWVRRSMEDVERNRIRWQTCRHARNDCCLSPQAVDHIRTATLTDYRRRDSNEGHFLSQR